MLQGRLAQVEELAKRTALQQETLKQGRQELETLRGDIYKFHESHAQVARPGDKLAADRDALEAFSERMTVFMLRTSQIDATLNAINGKLRWPMRGSRRRSGWVNWPASWTHRWIGFQLGRSSSTSWRPGSTACTRLLPKWTVSWRSSSPAAPSSTP